MAITLQALQADGTWAVRNAFTTENARVISGSMSAADLETKAHRLMGQWQQTMPDDRQLRVHNSANDPAPKPRKLSPRKPQSFATTGHTCAGIVGALEQHDAMQEEVEPPHRRRQSGLIR